MTRLNVLLNAEMREGLEGSGVLEVSVAIVHRECSDSVTFAAGDVKASERVFFLGGYFTRDDTSGRIVLRFRFVRAH